MQSVTVLLDIPTLANRLNTSPRHLRRLVFEKRIPYMKVGHLVRFDPLKIDEWLNSRRVHEIQHDTPS